MPTVTLNPHNNEHIKQAYADIDYNGKSFDVNMTLMLHQAILVKHIAFNRFNSIRIHADDKEWTFTRYSEDKSITWLVCPFNFEGDAKQLKAELAIISNAIDAEITKGAANLDEKLNEFKTTFGD